MIEDVKEPLIMRIVWVEGQRQIGMIEFIQAYAKHQNALKITHHLEKYTIEMILIDHRA